ncbi:MAG: response regulator [Lachnospiraceae bacterium]|nr:response regulator [Lachnospiraceae bacterium]
MIKIAICDDEKQDRERLQELVYEYAQKYEQTYKIEIFESGEGYLNSGLVADILFLDIIMNNKDGIQIGEEVRKQKGNTIIIYTTNLNEKMAIAFNRIHSFGYLMKPIKSKDCDERQTLHM